MIESGGVGDEDVGEIRGEALSNAMVVADDVPGGATDDAHEVPIVALGASAGGLEAIESFFSTVESPNSHAFVIVQHLSPDFKSLMVELLSRRTSLHVRQAVHNEEVQPNNIYLLPPAKTMIVVDGRLHLSDRESKELLHLPIDEFLTSLAADRGGRSIGVILSGSGNDGARGTRAILRAGGRVLVQSLDSAKFPSMPTAAIEAGANKEVMLPADMPQAIEGGIGSVANQLMAPGKSDSGVPYKLTSAIQKTFGLDFTAYKGATVNRRISRRMAARGYESIDDYAEFLADNPDEQEWLYYDLLIGVTAFFRDSEAFDQIRSEILPKLAEWASRGEEVRIWVPACATGEEAYSLAIVICEMMGEEVKDGTIRIFATDVHRRSLAVAAAGIYNLEPLKSLPPGLIEKYFTERDDKYQIKAIVRRMLIFSPHDLLKDPPFTKLDFISCRNFLIYLQPEAQKRVLATFTYSLNKGGFLFLGPSESLLDAERNFDEIDKPWRIFRKRQGATTHAPMEANHALVERRPQPVAANLVSRPAAPPRRDQRLALAYEALLDRYVPPSVLVDERGEVVHSFGDSGPFLAFRAGRASLAIYELIDVNLKAPLTSAIGRARRTGKPVSLSSLPYGVDQRQALGRLTVEPIYSRSESQTYMLVSFDQSQISPSSELIDIEMDADISTRIGELERDLRFTEENLQSTIEELETSNEELQASNEELMASNEELQSTNEELHSVNEELHTVSSEHQRKIEELTDLSHDMDSLLSSTDVAAVFIDKKLRIRRYTPAITRFFNLMPQDLGRPIEHVTHLLDLESLAADIRRVIDVGEAEKLHVRSSRSELRMDIRPYRDFEGNVAGAAVSFVDVTEYKAEHPEQSNRTRLFENLAAIVAPLTGATPKEAALVDGLYRGLAGLALPAAADESCDLAALLADACERQDIVLKAPTMPILRRDPHIVRLTIETLARFAGLSIRRGGLVAKTRDNRNHWGIALELDGDANEVGHELRRAAVTMIDQLAAKIDAEFEFDGAVFSLSFEKMRGDRLTIAVPVPAGVERFEPNADQVSPRRAKSQ